MSTRPPQLFVPDGELHDPDEIVAKATETHRPIETYLLCSGGNDSMALLDYGQRWGVTGILHVDTGTGVIDEQERPITTDFVRRQCADRGLSLTVLHPPKSYEEVFITKPIIDGLPGPGMHHVAFNRLKERALRGFVKSRKRRWKDRIMFLTGIREDESDARTGYQDSIIDRVGAQVWVNPIYRWTSEDMRTYRGEHGVPQNSVAQHIHISGECCCGCFPRPGEREEMAFFFPAHERRTKLWERMGRDRGNTYWRWGQRRPDEDVGKNLRLCRNCPGQLSLLEGQA